MQTLRPLQNHYVKSNIYETLWCFLGTGICYKSEFKKFHVLLGKIP